MRIRVSHQFTHAYETPAKSLLQALRLTPRNNDAQYVGAWRIDIDVDGQLKSAEDAFGNVLHQLSVNGPVERLTVSVTGEVDTQDTTGLVRGTVERFPDEIFLRETELTRCDDAVAALASAASAEAGGDPLGSLHALMRRTGTAVEHDPRAPHAEGAPQALAAGAGPARDLAHVFIAAARHLAVPARFVTGYLWQDGGPDELHSWAEASVPGYGWIAFDPCLDLCPVGAHVRVAVGLDYWGAAPIRAARYGGGPEHLDVSLRVESRDQAEHQSQG